MTLFENENTDRQNKKQEYAIKRPSSPNERGIMSFEDEHHPKMTKIQAENLAILAKRWDASRPPRMTRTGFTSAPFSDLNPYMTVPARWAMTELSESRWPGSAVAARAPTAVPWWLRPQGVLRLMAVCSTGLSESATFGKARRGPGRARPADPLTAAGL